MVLFHYDVLDISPRGLLNCGNRYSLCLLLYLVADSECNLDKKKCRCLDLSYLHYKLNIY